jgi:Ca-activated chloride channel family protein
MQKTGNTGKKINCLLFLFTLVAGAAWWGIGEIFFSFTKTGSENIIQNPLLNGVYFAFLLLFTILACLLSEKIVHSIVEKDFFDEVVMTPSLKKILPAAFAVMFLAAGVLEFIYEIEPSLDKSATVITKGETITQIDDFYFVVDDSGSLQTNDPRNVRITELKKLIDGLSEDKRISLVSFGEAEFAHVRQRLSSANSKGKEEFLGHLSRFNSGGPTTDILTALGLNEELIDKKTTRSAMVVLITDGENTDKGPKAPTSQYLVKTYSNLKIPIYSIFLGSAFTANARVFLENLSIPTGGKVIHVKDMKNFQEELTRVVYTEHKTLHESKSKPEPIRDMLEMRAGKRQNSFLYAGMHVGFVTLIGLLMGFFLYTVFSNVRLFKPLLLSGGISGLLAGFVLEMGLQSVFWPPQIIRLLACIILSTITWFLAYMCAVFIRVKYNKAVFACLRLPGDDGSFDYESRDNKLLPNDGDMEQSADIIDASKKSEQHNTGVLGK